ncbi:MAG: DUF5686 family protein, partial [Lachnospiraceae bacterium]|nr:DUF5686 family protein [Lachnospiraceae bacterium]
MELNEVVVRRKKYSKKNNPAVDFARKLRQMDTITDPERNPYYTYRKHELITLALNDFKEEEKDGSWMFGKFPFLKEHIDTSEISGKPILNLVAKEKISDVYYRRKPKARKEMIQALKQEGIDEIADQGDMLTYLEDVMREIDLYDNDINLLQNRFVSPLSRIAPDFYKFYLTDTVEVDGERCIVLSFYPHNKASFGFNGQVFVPVNDSTMFIKKVTMRTPRGINVNFVDNLYISQEFTRAPDGSRLKKSDDLTIELSLLPGTQGMYARRNTAYAGHSFAQPDSLGVFDGLGKQEIALGAEDRTKEFWREERLVPITENEENVGELMAKLRGVPIFYWTEKVLRVMFTGFIPTGKQSKFDFGPVNTVASHNDLEGWRFRLGGMTTAKLNKRLFANGYAAYGLKDRKWKYSAGLEYSFVDKEHHSMEFPVHSLRLTSMFDVNHIGQHYMGTSSDNFFLSLTRMKDHNLLYHNVNKLEYTLELKNNFSLVAGVENEIQRASRYMPLFDGHGQTMGKYSETFLTLELRYAPGEKFYQTKTRRVPINKDALIFTITHRFAPKGAFDSRYGVNTTELMVKKRFWFSAFGNLDALAKAGHVWSQSPYINLLIPNANISYTIQPESYACMNPMEFVNDSYASIDLSYSANGAIFNCIPLVKKLKLRECFGFKALWGELSKRNMPQNHPSLLQYPAGATVNRMTSTPYMEASVGIENIFRCLRLDYVWRLSYLDVPYAIDRRGVRVAMYMTF